MHNNIMLAIELKSSPTFTIGFESFGILAAFDLMASGTAKTIFARIAHSILMLQMPSSQMLQRNQNFQNQ